MSESPLVIAVDSSTTSTKAIIVDSAGEVLGEGRADVVMSTPRVDFYEQDPREWWSITNTAIGEAISGLSDQDKARVTHACCTIQRQSFALVDEAGEPLRPGILWLDGRAAEQVRRLGNESLHILSGFQPDVTPSFYKIAWLKDHEPEVLQKATKVVGVHAYLVHAMTGQWIDSRGTADSLGLFDMAQQEWSDKLLDLAGLRRDQVCDLVDPVEVIAPINADITKAWGLEQEVSLVAACGDGQAAALGAGAIGPDEAYLNMGTRWWQASIRPPTNTRGCFAPTPLACPGSTSSKSCRTPAPTWPGGSARSWVTRTWVASPTPTWRPRRLRCPPAVVAWSLCRTGMRCSHLIGTRSPRESLSVWLAPMTGL